MVWFPSWDSEHVQFVYPTTWNPNWETSLIILILVPLPMDDPKGYRSTLAPLGSAISVQGTSLPWPRCLRCGRHSPAAQPARNFDARRDVPLTRRPTVGPLDVEDPNGDLWNPSLEISKFLELVAYCGLFIFRT